MRPCAQAPAPQKMLEKTYKNLSVEFLILQNCSPMLLLLPLFFEKAYKFINVQKGRKSQSQFKECDLSTGPA
jgi:hypothetical protein